MEVEFVVKEKSAYTFALFFAHRKGDALSRDRIEALVGDAQKNKYGDYTNTGIGIPVVLDVFKKNKLEVNLVFHLEVSNFARYSSDGDGFYKRISDVNLEPGYYKAKIKSVANVSELEREKINFQVVLSHGK